MQKNHLIAKNKAIITISVSLRVSKILPSYCRRIAAVLPPYLSFPTAKIKIKLPSYFFPDSHG